MERTSERVDKVNWPVLLRLRQLRSYHNAEAPGCLWSQPAHRPQRAEFSMTGALT